MPQAPAGPTDLPVSDPGPIDQSRVVDGVLWKKLKSLAQGQERVAVPSEFVPVKGERMMEVLLCVWACFSSVD